MAVPDRTFQRSLRKTIKCIKLESDASDEEGAPAGTETNPGVKEEPTVDDTAGCPPSNADTRQERIPRPTDYLVREGSRTTVGVSHLQEEALGIMQRFQRAAAVEAK